MSQIRKKIVTKKNEEKQQIATPNVKTFFKPILKTMVAVQGNDIKNSEINPGLHGNIIYNQRHLN